MIIEHTGKFGCFDCMDYKTKKTNNSQLIKSCEHDICPYWDEEKMKKNGVSNYIEWIMKGRPDCYPEMATE